MSRYGDPDKDYIFDEMESFRRDNSLSDLMEVVADLSFRYVEKDHESEVYQENNRLKRELAEIKSKISGLLEDKSDECTSES